MRLLPFAVLLLAGHHVAAHVRLYYEPARMPIRNAQSATSDGQMSTSGPCGGANTWGSNGVSKVKNGAEVSLRINYNGGHKSPANAFSMAFTCGKPGNQDLLKTAKLAASACTNTPYPVPSPDGNTVRDGYTLTCSLPSQDLSAADGEKCTVSVLDQRDWGGCVDIELEAVAPPVPPQPVAINHQGVYAFSKFDSIVTDKQGVCCKLDNGKFQLLQSSPTSTQVVATMTATGYQCASGALNIDAAITMTRSGGGPRFIGQTTIMGQPVQVTAVDSYVEWTNTGTENPLVCDGYARLDAEASKGMRVTSGAASTQARRASTMSVAMLWGVATVLAIVAARD